MKTKFDHPKPVSGTSLSFYTWLIILMAGMYPLGYYVSRYFLYGIPIFGEYIGSSVPWGFLVPVYVFFVLAGSGLCLVASLGHIFRIGEFELISRRAIFLAIVMLLSGFTAIAIDLGRIERAYIPFLASQNFASPMMWMMALYVMYFIVILFEFWLLSRMELARRAHSHSGLKSTFYRLLTFGFSSVTTESGETDHRLARIVGVGALVLAIAAPSNLGAIFGVTKARPLWFGAYMPLFFVVTAFMSGVAILLFTAIISLKVSGRSLSREAQGVFINLGRILGLLLVVYLVFASWKVMTSLFTQIPLESAALDVLLNGPLMLQFWGLELALGGVVPFFLLVYPKTGRNLWGVLAASSLVVLSMFFVRYDLIIAGQVIPSLEGPAPFYIPSQIEIALFVGLASLATLIYSVGQKIFPLSEDTAIKQATTPVE